MRLLKLSAVLLAATLLDADATMADDACPGSGEGILTISHPAPAGAPTTVVLDSACIESLPRHKVRTSTPWTGEGAVVEFEGVLMRDLLRRFDLEGKTADMGAHDEYQSSAPLLDFERYDVLLAFKQDGKPLEAGDKGPLWVIYPIDDHPELANDEAYHKMVWQLSSIDMQ